MNITEGYSYIGTKDVGFDNSVNYNNGVKIPYEEPKFKVAPAGATLLYVLREEVLEIKLHK